MPNAKVVLEAANAAPIPRHLLHPRRYISTERRAQDLILKYLLGSISASVISCGLCEQNLIAARSRLLALVVHHLFIRSTAHYQESGGH